MSSGAVLTAIHSRSFPCSRRTGAPPRPPDAGTPGTFGVEGRLPMKLGQTLPRGPRLEEKGNGRRRLRPLPVHRGSKVRYDASIVSRETLREIGLPLHVIGQPVAEALGASLERIAIRTGGPPLTKMSARARRRTRRPARRPSRRSTRWRRAKSRAVRSSFPGRAGSQNLRELFAIGGRYLPTDLHAVARRLLCRGRRRGNRHRPNDAPARPQDLFRTSRRTIGWASTASRYRSQRGDKRS